MKISDYPAQEPFTEIGQKYHAEVMARADHVQGVDVLHGDDPYQSLTVFQADNPSGDVLCMMHGGGWTNGYKEWMAFMAPALTSQGVTFVSLGYRLAPEHVFPAGFSDCCDGLSWVHNNIASVGGDPNRIFVGGHSAGGHYCALIALKNNWQDARDLPLSVVKGALPISGTYDFGVGSGLSMRPRFLGPVENNRDADASPNRLVTTDAPGFLVSYGDQDFPHLIRQAQEFVGTLRQANVLVQVLELPNCTHLGASYAAGKVGGEWVVAARIFMKSQQ